jgi:phage tail-like protein
MTLPDLDTSVDYSFGLELDGVIISQIHKVHVVESEQNFTATEQNASDGKRVTEKLLDRPKGGEVIFIRVLPAESSFEKWVKDTRFGTLAAARKGGHIIVYNYNGDAIKRYNITNPWPKSHEISTAWENHASVLTEKLVITYELLDPE